MIVTKNSIVAIDCYIIKTYCVLLHQFLSTFVVSLKFINIFFIKIKLTTFITHKNYNGYFCFYNNILR